MSERLTILFAPMDAYGHFNACIGLAEPLRDRGHRIVFATPNGWKGKMLKLGFEEEPYSTESDNTEQNGNGPAAAAMDLFGKMAHGMAQNTWDQITAVTCTSFPFVMREMAHRSEDSFKTIVAKVKPSVIVFDGFFTSPALMNSGIPWILCASCTPLGITEENVPPTCSGLPTDGNPKEWERFRELQRKAFHDMNEEHSAWVIKHGGERVEGIFPYYMKYSPYANLYMYPTELDYTDRRPNPPNWYHFETFIRSCEDTFEIPPELNGLPGKLIYFSMGSMGSSEILLMKRLIEILGKSPHRFIVSTGPRCDEFTLAENMWGSNFVPQTKVIPLVDLVITHGGNNTVTESFYYGKPCIVLPLFGDQHDNGQRIKELGLGFSFPPYQVKGEELLPAIEHVLADQSLLNRMEAIAKRIQSIDTKSLTADLIEKVAMRVELSK